MKIAAILDNETNGVDFEEPQDGKRAAPQEEEKKARLQSNSFDSSSSSQSPVRLPRRPGVFSNHRGVDEVSHGEVEVASSERSVEESESSEYPRSSKKKSYQKSKLDSQLDSQWNSEQGKTAKASRLQR